MQPVIHHIEVCVNSLHETLKLLEKYGFIPFAKRETAFCKQVAAKLSSVVFIVTEKSSRIKTENKKSFKNEDFVVLCSRCEDETSTKDDHVDTVFNISLHVKNVAVMTERILKHDANAAVRTPTSVEDHCGRVDYSIVKGKCGNVLHTLLNKDYYSGFFLPGFMPIGTDCETKDFTEISHIDHVTLACATGLSDSIIEWYQSAFGMDKFRISRDDTGDGLILKEGIGLKLRAMEYWMCSETGLVFKEVSSETNERSPQSLMLVVVEPLPGQKNCNITKFLRNHASAGVEHIAFSSCKISSTVSRMMERGVKFRLPPASYYSELKQCDMGVNINFDKIRRLGILVDREDPDEGETKPKFLMQIFSEPLYQRKTFFIEIIQRLGATGLGAGNVISLLRSIREDESRKAAEENRLLEEENPHTRIC